MLQLNNVKKIYQTKSGEVNALNGVNMTFNQTGMVFITGKSGCGKTTLLNVIGGLDGFDQGEVLLFGKSFKDFTAEEYDSYRNTFIGFVFQEYNLLGEYTVEKNIKIAMELQGISPKQSELDELLSIVEISELKNRKPSELSGGQRQRVAIARALVKSPKIIIADEPTGALDSNTAVQVFDILKKLSKEKLIIVVSHDREFAEKYADRIIRLVDGNVVEDVTFTENEISENIKEQEDSLIVKNGADLSEKEKDLIAKAVKQRKKIEVIEKVSYREKAPTPDIEIESNIQPVKLKKSQMKFKSAFSLGLKSLGVKPLRLILTIILSAVAFSVFGLFDTIANFNTADVINYQLQQAGLPSVMTSAKYIVDANAGDEYVIRVSQDTIKEVEQNTGYSIKGIYYFNNNSSGYVPSETIQEISSIYTYRGKNFYTNKINGLIEFNADEISDGKISKYGYEIVEGRYPVLQDKENGIFYAEKEIAISTYLADCLLYYLNGEPLQEVAIEKPEDLIDKYITVNSLRFKIVGLIDCGAIPEKYLPLMDSASNSVAYQTLAVDFNTYINSGAQKCLFMPEGFLDWYKTTERGYASVFVAGDSNWSVKNGLNSRQASNYVYSINQCDYTDVLTFSVDFTKNDTIKDDEVLVHPNNLTEVFYEEYLQSNRDAVKGHISDIKTNTDLDKKKESLEKLFKELGIDKYSRNRKISLTKRENNTDNIITKEVKVVGIYLGIESSSYTQTYKFVMNENLMKEYNVCLGQGDFARLMFSPNGSLFGTKRIAEYMCSKSGFALNWYSNSVINVISQNEQTIRQSADLFLYASIVLAVFSIFMFFNYIATSVINKRSTIGILRCLGANGKNILTIFTIESLVMALVNAILATAITAVGCVLVNLYIANVMNISVAFAIFGIRQFLIIFAISMLTAIISSAFPIIKISKEKPVELIRKA